MVFLGYIDLGSNRYFFISFMYMRGLLLRSHPPYSFHCVPIVIYLVMHLYTCACIPVPGYLYMLGVWRIIIAANRGYYYLGGSGAELYLVSSFANFATVLCKSYFYNTQL